MKTIQKTVYVAEDGKEFTSDKACSDHEKFLIEQEKRLQNLKIYTVNYSFEATEGRGYYRRVHIITDKEYEVVLQYCYNTFGPPLKPWYGSHYYKSWIINESTGLSVKEALKQQGLRVSQFLSSDATIEVVLLSTSDIEYPEVPAAIMPKY